MAEDNSFLNTIYLDFKDRLSNPFLMPFLFSWLLWNWKFLTILFLGDYDIKYKINLLVSNYSSIENTLLLPLSSSILYVLFSHHFYLWLDKNKEKIVYARETQKLNHIERIKSIKEEIAETTEEALEAQERAIAAEDKLEENQENKTVQDNIPLKQHYMQTPFEKGPLKLDTNGSGATLSFNDIKTTFRFDGCYIEDYFDKKSLLFSNTGTSVYSIYDEDNGISNDNYVKLDNSEGLEKITINFNKPTQRITIKNEHDFDTGIINIENLSASYSL